MHLNVSSAKWRPFCRDLNELTEQVVQPWSYPTMWSLCLSLRRCIMMTSSNGNIFRVTVRGIHRPPVNSPHKGQWRGALMFSLICVWINGWVNNGETGDLTRYLAHYDVRVMIPTVCNVVNSTIFFYNFTFFLSSSDKLHTIAFLLSVVCWKNCRNK